MVLMTDALTRARNALIADATLQAWATLKFSKSVRVDIGLDTRSAPEAADYPLIVIAARRQQISTGGGMHVLEIDLVCYAESGAITADGRGQIFDGFLLVGELRELACKALIRQMRAKVIVPEQQSEAPAEFPLFSDVFTVTIEEQIPPAWRTK